MDASVENTILTMLRDQGIALVEQGKVIARVEENIRGSHERLFGGSQPGILQTIEKRHQDMETKFSELDEDIKNVKSDIKVKKAYVIGYSSAAATFGTIALSWIGKKLGLHF